MMLKEKYKRVLNEFLDKEKNEEIVIGIFVSGSYVLDDLHANSDLDVFMVTTDTYIQIAANVIEGIELECCYKPLKQYYYDLNITRNPVDIQRYAIGEILYDPMGEVQPVIARANEIYIQGPNNKINDSDLYHLSDLFLDLEDRINSAYGRVLLVKAFEQLIKVYFKKENLWECKISQCIAKLKAHHAEVGQLAEDLLMEQKLNNQYQKLLLLKEIIMSGVQPLDKLWKTPRIIAPALKEELN
ncbi:hypothetical protein EHS13_34320 [Paenibacillus psychroresistens]|uniref:Polymerase nucleotidyl transferase domain-containing protein n=1 Tax=Paenibacillus psychroresistens TaxID=1778678 RepID=A0A6B8RT03_9BACL|nr:nucleotidyltransferase domain-containing protein [Paenibacillus psychroresistens]QGQ99580.1 hypothetical protein EHS13_34320 [Paenibacillus psychroresistens]